MARLVRRLASVGLILVAIDFFDELASGLPAAGAPELRADLGTGVAALTIAVFTTPLVLSLLVDVPLLLWAERRSRAKMVALGVFGMGLSLVAAALATSVVGFALAFAIANPEGRLAVDDSRIPSHDQHRQCRTKLSRQN